VTGVHRSSLGAPTQSARNAKTRALRGNDSDGLGDDAGDMTDLTSHGTSAREREYCLGQDLRVTIWTTGDETEGRHDLIEAHKAAGQMTPLHLHRRYEERIWVVSGELAVWAGDDHAVLRSGDFVHVPLDVPHAIQAGAEGCRTVNVSSPAGFAELVARAGTPADLITAETELDLELFMEVTTDLGDVVLGPPGTLPSDVSAAELAAALAEMPR
jgi:mannose-6-phosphate isomerase-like protein (cupin superfamily)